MSTDDQEEFRQLRAALRQSNRDLAQQGKKIQDLEAQLQHNQEALKAAWEQLDAIRHSTSWRITGPIRRIRRPVK